LKLSCIQLFSLSSLSSLSINTQPPLSFSTKIHYQN
jgi:hypothetical protein